MKKLIRFHLVILLLLLQTTLFGQYQISNFTSFNTGDNTLGSNTIYQFERNPTTNDLWINSEDGLMYYDGFVYHQNSIPLNAGNRYIYSNRPFAFDFNGNLWFVITDSLYNYDGINLEPHALPLTTMGVNDILCDQNSIVWIATNNGLFKFDNGIFEIYNETNVLLSNYVQCLTIEPSGELWVGTILGVNLYDGNQWKSYNQNDGLVWANGNSGIDDFYVDNNGTCWALGNEIAYFENQQWIVLDPTILTSSLVTLNNFTGAFETSNGRIYFSTNEHGLVYRENNNWSRLTTNDGLPCDSILTTYTDLNGEVLLGHYRYGYSKTTDGINYENINTKDGGIIENYTRKIYVDSSNVVWINHADAYQYSTDNAFWNKFLDNKTTIGSNIAENRYGDIVIFGYGDLFIYDSIQWDTIHDWDYNIGVFIEKDQYVYHANYPNLKRFTYQGQDTLSLATTIDLSPYFSTGTMIHCMEVDSSNTLWLGTKNGLWYMDQLNLVFEPLPEDISQYITDVRVDYEQNLWVTTLNGIGHKVNGQWSTYFENDGLIDNHVNEMEITPDSAYWFATYKGVTRIKNQQFESFDVSDGLIHKFCKTIHKDYLGNIYVGTVHGISMFHEAYPYVEDTLAIQNTINQENHFSLYPNPAHDHLLLNCESFNQIKSMKIIDVTGKVMIETPIKYQTSNINVSKLQPGIYFVQVHQNNGSVSSTQFIKL